jgi:hypothetical protein
LIQFIILLLRDVEELIYFLFLLDLAKASYRHKREVGDS